jgi:prepilin peptidase CpaA
VTADAFALGPAGAAWLALALAGPLAALGGLWDLRRMRIPNWLNAALALLFVPVAALTLPLEAALWRVAVAAGVLLAGYALFVAGRMGGGDVKMLAAAALWIPPAQAGGAMFLLSVALLAGLALVLGARRFTAPDTPWRGLRRHARRFPMGVSIGAALVAHLVLSLPSVTA